MNHLAYALAIALLALSPAALADEGEATVAVAPTSPPCEPVVVNPGDVPPVRVDPECLSATLAQRTSQ